MLREPKEPHLFAKTIEMYYNNIFEGEKKGAIMMGVCRGRMSEGLDFSDDAARLVIVVGIPYPMVADPKIVLKKH